MANSKRIIIVSGGSKGLGYEIVQSLLLRNYIVVSFSRNVTEGIQKIMDSKYKNDFMWESVEVTDYKSLSAFIKKVIERFSHIDALINNVGMASEGILTLIPQKVITQLIDVNLKSTINLTQLCVKNMLPRKSGIIINISSVNGIRGFAGVSLYSATKSALDGFTRSIARELAPRGILVNSIAPGYLQTDMTSNLTQEQLNRIVRRTPLGRLGRTEDIVGCVEFLLSPAANFITGQTIVVDGGLTC